MYVNEIEIYNYTVLKTMNCMGCKYTYNICVNLGRLHIYIIIYNRKIEQDETYETYTFNQTVDKS